jgi:hypothetical protein
MLHQGGERAPAAENKHPAHLAQLMQAQAQQHGQLQVGHPQAQAQQHGQLQVGHPQMPSLIGGPHGGPHGQFAGGGMWGQMHPGVMGMNPMMQQGPHGVKRVLPASSSEQGKKKKRKRMKKKKKKKSKRVRCECFVSQ